MRNAKNIFHGISYLQYPLYVIAIIYIGIGYYDLLALHNIDRFFVDMNNGLIFLGLGISLSTLQDTKKMQNNISKKVWESRRKGKIALIILSVTVLVFILSGLFGLYIAPNSALRDMSLGFIVLGIGCIGLLKAAIEMHDHHRKD